MGDLCANRISFYENGRKWRLILVRNTEHPIGPFWYLPHDNENAALDSAVYAVKKYGGGFLAVEAEGERYSHGQDPNRYFKVSSTYTRTIFKIIDTFKAKGMPYLTLHNNKESHMKFGGNGTVSIRVSSRNTFSYPSGKVLIGRHKGLKDEDNLIYLAGTKDHKKFIHTLHQEGIHVKYEIPDRHHNDHSMSNYVMLYKKNKNYFNIETEVGDTATQKKIIDTLMKVIYLHH